MNYCMSQICLPSCGMMKSLSNPTQDQDNPPVSVFKGKLVPSDEFSLSHTPSPLQWKPSSVKLYESLRSREAVKWLRLSASSSSRKCLCLDLCLLRRRFSVPLVGIPPVYVEGNQLWRTRVWPTVCTDISWSVKPGQVWGAINGKPTFQKALGFHGKLVTVRCWCFYPKML